MRERLPRRYDAAAKFFRQTIANEKIGHRVRFQAALRLSEILLEHDRAELRKELARERASGRSGEPPEPSEPTQAEPRQLTPAEAEQEARAFLERLRQKETNVE